MNMIQKAKEQVQELTKQAYAAAVKEGLLPEGVTVEPSVEIPRTCPTATIPPPSAWRRPRP